MAYILSIETATDKLSIALHQSGQLLSMKELNEKGVHAEKIMELIDEVLDTTNLRASDLKAVAVSEGPGSYTGLRIGVSTAKGIAFALGLPLITVNTLQALAYQAKEENEDFRIIAMLDARRMEVYSQVFSNEGSVKRALEAEVLTEEVYQSYLDLGKVYFIGDAVGKASQVILHENAVFLENQVSAESVGRIAWEKYQNKEFVNLAYFVPNYLKEFKALHSKKNPLLQ
ncbi:tRNA (adenosine(37)-N6)-threonylcarbamoyltransferase complex dimerization subunit type 1 TsaB [Algoriphagus algorifonticola]|uniref:tRNA (adenosine(37)-N6)-threonylcarbamoyltransferase complex dimerization subunit type 1 TsaB n=1 Tax=Algoriphagus algorifonticola TaxID=2593007 RepID=UPI0011A9BCE8|nr:tRNA (adenosine(37)-N6)-threonylcarbamoyltransferase complex dimerization subunit type 1 TsaB [Algoriphagus algorifonticola]